MLDLDPLLAQVLSFCSQFSKWWFIKICRFDFKCLEVIQPQHWHSLFSFLFLYLKLCFSFLLHSLHLNSMVLSWLFLIFKIFFYYLYHYIPHEMPSYMWSKQLIISLSIGLCLWKHHPKFKLCPQSTSVKYENHLIIPTNLHSHTPHSFTDVSNIYIFKPGITQGQSASSLKIRIIQHIRSYPSNLQQHLVNLSTSANSSTGSQSIFTTFTFQTSSRIYSNTQTTTLQSTSKFFLTPQKSPDFPMPTHPKSSSGDLHTNHHLNFHHHASTREFQEWESLLHQAASTSNSYTLHLTHKHQAT